LSNQLPGKDRKGFLSILISRPRLSTYLPEPAIRPYLAYLAALFVAGILVGILSPPAIRQQVAEGLLEFLEPFQNRDGGELFLLIMVNNTIATFFMLLFGVLFGILPVLSVAANGFLLGVIYLESAGTVGYRKAVLHVLPHGVFEILAFLIAASYGMWLGVTFIQRIRHRDTDPLGRKVLHAVRMYFTIVFPLFVIAAAIETALIVI
jgi:stage II sporulation protein M